MRPAWSGHCVGGQVEGRTSLLTMLDQLVQRWVISEIVGHKKPDGTLRNDVSAWAGPPPVRGRAVETEPAGFS